MIECLGETAARGTCNFLTNGFGGDYSIFANPIPGDTAVHTVEFSISYDSPLL